MEAVWGADGIHMVVLCLAMWKLQQLFGKFVIVYK